MPLHQTRLTVRIPAQPHLRLDARGIHKILWPRFIGLEREHFWRDLWSPSRWAYSRMQGTFSDSLDCLS